MNKTITLFLLLLIPFATIGQTWDFESDEDGWSGAGASFAHNGTHGVLSFTESQNFPKLVNGLANVNAANITACKIVLKNNSNNTYLRLSYPNGGGRTYENLYMTTNDTSFHTYVFFIDGGSWSGTVNDIQFHVRLNEQGGAPGHAVEGNVEIDLIEFQEFPVLNDFTFDLDEQEWFSALNSTVTHDANGYLVLTPGANNASSARMTLGEYANETFDYMYIRYRNTSNNLEIRVQFTDQGGDDSYSGRGMNVGISGGMEPDAEFVEQRISMSDITSWNNVSHADRFQIHLRTSGNASVNDGILEIDRILFTDQADAVLSTQDVQLNNFAIYPNPAQNVLNIQAENATEISEVRMYSLLGQEVQRAAVTGRNAQVDVSSLRAGMYVVEIDSDLGTKVSKFIKR